MNDATPAPLPSRALRQRAIGRLYVDLGLISRPELNHALIECARTHSALPEVLRRLGYLA